MNNIETLKRPTKKQDDDFLFDMEPDWRSEWWGMPEFIMGDATPQYKITINFMTKEDIKKFSELLGIQLSAKSDSAWFPKQKIDEPKEWCYVEN